jgi:transglutaminase-like putative cysteine protease
MAAAETLSTPLRRSAALWPLGLLLLALAAHSPALPLAAWLAFAVALFSRRLPPRRWAPIARLSGLAACYVASGLVFGWLDATTLRLNLLLVLALKWAESRNPRDYALVAAAAVVAVAIGLLQWGDGIGLAFVLAAALLLVAGADGRTGIAPAPVLRSASRHLLVALPLAAVLFLFFPRIPGPLWDIGLTFGLPLPIGIEQSNQGLGISARLKPGQTQTGASDGQPVLVAEFANWVPPTSQLYWRGPVFYDFDGREWRLDEEYTAGNGRRIMPRGWRRGGDFGQNLRSTAQEVHYKVRLTPHNGLWLYGLDLPSRLTAESFIGPDWQVLAHQPVQREISYELSSWLEWTAGGELAPALRERALSLPPGSNPRLRALGDKLRQHPATEIPRQALVELASGGFKVRDRFEAPAGEHALDAFWFDTKEGNSEFYAAAFVVLMRSAGVPARLVTGYRGGKLMALTDYVVVKRGHAHAWTEVWDEANGWRRIDPTDLIAPEKFAGSQAKAKTAPQPAGAPAPAKKAGTDSPPPPAPAGGLAGNAAPVRAAAGSDWKLPDIGAWLGRWIFRLDAEQQMSLLAGKGGGFAWLWLLAAAAAGSTAIFGGHLLLQRWRAQRRLPPPERAWRCACRLLGKRGWPIGVGECPTRYAARVGAAHPAWADALHRLATGYAEWRYGRAPAEAAGAIPGAARLLINRILSQST